MPDLKICPPVSPTNDQPPPFAYLARPPRLRTYLHGKLVFSDVDDFAARNTQTLDCAIRDMSEGGARITLVRQQAMSSDVFLISVKHHMAYQAKVMWMKFPARGLKFLHSYMLKGELPDELKFLQGLSSDLDSRSGIYPSF